MNLCAVIFFSAFAVVCVYFIFRALFSAFARREIAKSKVVRKRKDTFQIYADANSLEYYIRMASAVKPEMNIIVNIDQRLSDAKEQEFIAQRLSHRASRLKIHYTN